MHRADSDESSSWLKSLTAENKSFTHVHLQYISHMVAEGGHTHGSGHEPATRYAANAREHVAKVEAELQKIFGSVLAQMDENIIRLASAGEGAFLQDEG